MKEVDTEDALAYWVAKAKTGEKVVYYDGFLMRDRMKLVMNGVDRSSMPQKIKAAMLAWRYYLEGAVALVQHKRDEGEYEYIAVKR